MSRSALACLAGLVAVACGGGSAPATVRPSPTPSAQATAPTAVPAPDVQRIDVVATGVGTWQLVTVPVAVIHNASARSVATGVFVHLTPTRAGRPLTPLLTPALTLYPGQTIVVAANCTDTCVGGDGATAVAAATSWAAPVGTPLVATTRAISCRLSCTGHGQWDVPITVGSPGLLANEQVELFATCSDASGRLIGGGQRTLIWPAAGGTLDLHIPVIVSAPPTACQVSATTAN